MPPRAATYLDFNAGAPLSRKAREAILLLLDEAGVEAGPAPRPSLFPSPLLPNPSSVHSEGRRARKWLEAAREQVARSLGAQTRPEEVLFTSSGTEAAQAAVRAMLEPRLLRGERPHWILTAGEHEAVHRMAEWIRARGGSVDRLPLQPGGAPDAERLEALIRPETALISAIWVNNETGVISDILKISQVAAARGVALHLDGAQAWGKLPIDLRASGAMLASFSGHKIGGLAGSGVLWVAARSPASAALTEAPVFAGHQESGKRGGTGNLLGAVALGAAASELDPPAWQAKVLPERERLERLIGEIVPGVRVHGAGQARVANTSSLGFEGIEKDGLVASLDLAGYCVSAGSACSSGVSAPSRVLMAMGLSESQARGALRVSFSSETGRDELEGFARALSEAVRRMRRATGDQRA